MVKIITPDMERMKAQANEEIKAKLDLEDIAFAYGNKQIKISSKKILKTTDPATLISFLSRLLFYRDFYANLYIRSKMNSKRAFSEVDANKRMALRSFEDESKDAKGKKTFKATEQMIKDEVLTDPKLFQFKNFEYDQLFILNRLNSMIDIVEWKLEIATNVQRRRSSSKAFETNAFNHSRNEDDFS